MDSRPPIAAIGRADLQERRAAIVGAEGHEKGDMATGGLLIVESLAAHGIDRVFCVPGESYLGLLDALYEHRASIDTVVCRHESGAGFMALADARLTGRPGMACVSRGPGASNAVIAVHTAQQDGVPFILLIGQVSTGDLRRDAFQEIDYGRMFGGLAKWTVEITDPARIPEAMLRAFQVATTGVPGPVVIAVPEDVLTASAARVPPLRSSSVRCPPEQSGIEAIETLLGRARRPLLLAGSAIDRPGGRAALLAAAERWALPVLVAFRRHDLFPNHHPLYAGEMGLANPPEQMAVLDECDLLLVAGARLSDITTQGYRFPMATGAGPKLIHVHSDPAVIGTHFPTDLALACDPAATLAALAESKAGGSIERSEWCARVAHERYKIARPRMFDVDDGIPFESVVARIAGHLPSDAIVTVDAGTFGAPVYRLIRFAGEQRLLAPISGAMGFGVPAAVAAGLRAPERTILCFVGDGGFLMTGNELAVAKERNLPLKVVLSENGVYGSIRIHQARDYPGRFVGTGFVNPDLAMIGAAFGFAVSRLSTPSDLDRLPALLAAEGPQFIIVDTSVEAVMPATAAQGDRSVL